MRQLIAGNWKMNGLTSSLREVADLSSALRATPPHCDVLVCPPATLISRAVQTGGVAMMFGGQDCHAETSGAYTGDLSAEMLADAGAKAVIVGHSERRRYHGETDALVASKARAAWRAGLFAIICIGETLSERESGLAETICKSQLSGSVPTGATGENTVIAYEPIWAIGTGKTPDKTEIATIHSHIRRCLGPKLRILYGGSVNATNAREILSLGDVDGALVGGASLKAAEFLAIISACRAT
ncbi:MAG TPA: triose-phosphate isomerase [Rhizomicrobium sp.]|jgi:triosephosphate isomerase|nr:triose-phosphate isomerase [Rhizomicrobium sp.]